ncbi:MAG: 2-oxo-4-hydroxy-4-carboxy-5-ureidoimidazoline decarboxylase [Gammaproteobacteria bacterium]|nr:2-oxo-4-hydroxy-4-carboxy-5-ureidoimidazoline decarboxylase [Gammaproteobacteria bacterium]MDA7967942.1 2-oxo-4-hydroxy-4-carboxy-5-ureidoimidazoline decarboxylase [Gammaproteobacteria bacterium]MDA7969932.1 2-oxo-4-hydroxy-4-carboxy-5-ureidoimidazoline decarboxylase [Gammaproteobacteria bacterium]MDA7990991.1 2-oxo-4-hydroxy-4-carboxy-5-ureidoimidazoline decarboxylase [Gammaproteobacteria bacterium]MDA7994911.1 2-oxo-4-hydroxy-4-carboxy-5-ureidoimidazoline decarboxylase [Gammaproteobacteria
MRTLEQFNQLGEGEAREWMLGCCGSARWAGRMAESRPFASQAVLADTADAHWREMESGDFLEAFRAHPKIGDPNSAKHKPAGAKAEAAARATAAREQAGVNHASADVLESLARGNREYEEKFGFIFIVCASGKSAAEMLELLQARIGNARDAEIANAAEEQRKITQIRLRGMFAGAAA